MTDQSSSRLPGSVPQALGRLRVALNDSYTDASRELGLTPQQAELLCAAMRPTPVGDLARLLHCDRSNVSRLVDRAATRGLLKRRGEQRDGRVSTIELTPAGQRLATRFLARLESLTQPLLATWSAQQQHAAAETLRALAGTLENPVSAAIQPHARPKLKQTAGSKRR